MHLSDFTFELPDELIAHYPEKHRTDSRLLYLAADGGTQDLNFPDCLNLLAAGDVLVLNDTKVIPARLSARKETGGKAEILLERVIDDSTIVAQIRASKAPKVGSKLLVGGFVKEGFVKSGLVENAVVESGLVDNSLIKSRLERMSAQISPIVSYESPNKNQLTTLTVQGREDSFFVLSVDDVSDIYAWFDEVGELPLPPYIERADKPSEEDKTRYQTVFAKHLGAVAAPTAGLHFDEALLARLKAKGVKVQTITLHVGAGTYQPVRVDNVLEHKMHTERVKIDQATCDAINAAKQAGGKVVAVGTTVVRCLESVAQKSKTNQLQAYSGYTNIFIYPGFDFKVIDKLITNFHLSESTLLMLVSALSSREAILNAYQHAIAERYRFFSYGDAMFIERATLAQNSKP